MITYTWEWIRNGETTEYESTSLIVPTETSGCVRCHSATTGGGECVDQCVEIHWKASWTQTTHEVRSRTTTFSIPMEGDITAGHVIGGGLLTADGVGLVLADELVSSVGVAAGIEVAGIVAMPVGLWFLGEAQAAHIREVMTRREATGSWKLIESTSVHGEVKFEKSAPTRVPCEGVSSSEDCQAVREGNIPPSSPKKPTGLDASK